MSDRALAAKVMVSEDEADIRLDRWLRRHVPGLPQSAIQKLCRNGQVRVDGRRADAAARLGAGQSVRIPPVPKSRAPTPASQGPEAIEPELARDLQRLVLYRDAHLIAIDKPYGLPVQGGPGIVTHLDALLDAFRFGAPDRPRLVHRLDRDTSGVLLLARTPGTAARLAALFRGRAIDKTYWAVTNGRPVPPAGRIDRALVRTGALRGERAALAGPSEPDGVRAITGYETLDYAGKLAWLELHPLTGRTHQLRVHCASLAAPILGDVKYAAPDQNGAFAATVAGLSDALHLHARALRLPHPGGGTLEIEANLPRHMAETFRTLGFNAPAARPSWRG